MSFSTQTPLSVTIWINATWNPGARRSFVGIYGGATDTPLIAPTTGVQIGTGNGAGDLMFWTWGGASLCTTAANVMTTYNGKWIMVTYTYDGTTHRGYVNGAQVCTGTSVPLVGYLNQVFINGYPTGGVSEISAFQLDQYGLYNRALLADEVLTMYNAYGYRHGVTNSLVCRYEFDEYGEGTTTSTLPDLSGNGHTLTNIGAGTPVSYTYLNTFASSNIRPVQ
jgi:hypothetical protein